MNLRLTPDARRDLAWLRPYFGAASKQRRTRVVRTLERSFRLVTDNPEIGTAHPRIAEARVWPMRDIPFSLIYRTERDGSTTILNVRDQRDGQ